MEVSQGVLEKRIRGEIRYHVSMAEFTSFRVGGPVSCLVFPADREDLRTLLQWCLQERVPYMIIGKGTNLLVRDGGIQGIAINLSQGFNRLDEVERNSTGSVIFAEGGETLAKVVDFSWRHDLIGLEFAAGIPGSVGGAIHMNAGAFGREMKDALLTIELMDAAGNLREEKIEELNPSYRSMGLRRGDVILGGKFFLKRGKGEEIRTAVEGIMRSRLAKQPYDLPSAGSVFKNPPQAPAGKLIEEAGLKGARVGDAQVSEKHANFIVNRGKASARDILELVERVKETVYREKNVLLDLEIHVAGEN